MTETKLRLIPRMPGAGTDKGDTSMTGIVFTFGLLLMALFTLAWPALRDKVYTDWRTPLQLIVGIVQEEFGMSYLGKNTMGQGTPIPTIQSGPNAGQLDINSLVGQLVDQQKSYVYDTLKLAPGATVTSQPYRMFQVPIGQGDPYNGNITKTEQETNMRSAGFFSPPYDFILNNLGFYVLIGAQLFDIQTIFNLGWFEFKILAKQQFMGHFQRHPSGMGVSGFSTVSQQQNWLNGQADPRAIWYFGDWKKYIPPQTNFTLNINFGETFQQYYNAATSASLPASIRSAFFDNSYLSSTSTLPTLLPQAQGGNGIQLLCVMNGISNGPVQ